MGGDEQHSSLAVCNRAQCTIKLIKLPVVFFLPLPLGMERSRDTNRLLPVQFLIETVAVAFWKGQSCGDACPRPVL